MDGCPMGFYNFWKGSAEHGLRDKNKSEKAEGMAEP